MIKSIYRCAADDGVVVGLYLSAIFLTMVFSVKLTLLSLVGMLLLLGVPALIFTLMRRYYISCGGMATYSALWMLGIMQFCFGSLICAVVTYSYLEFVAPQFIYSQLKVALDFYENNAGYVTDDTLSLMQQIYEKRQLPSAIDFSVTMMWLTSFCGSLLSMLLAAIVSLIKIRK